MGGEQFPSAMCPLHEEQLKRIEAVTTATNQEVKSLVSVDGPLGRLISRVDRVEGATSSVHHRLDELVGALEAERKARVAGDGELHEKLWSLVIRAAAVALGALGAIGGVIYGLVRLIER